MTRQILITGLVCLLVAATALACASRAEQRNALEHEIEKHLGAPGRSRLAALETLRSEARAAAESKLVEKYRRFARWFLAGCERQQDPDFLAVVAHVERGLETPDQPLLVGADRDREIPLYLSCTTERALLGKGRRYRQRMMRVMGAIALFGFGGCGAVYGANFLIGVFAFTCVTIPSAGVLWFALRTRPDRP